MAYLIGIKNVTTQTVPVDGSIALGSVYRQYSKKSRCGTKTFNSDATSLALQQEGLYHITATFVGSATVAGDVTIQLLENGVAIPGVLTTETITTAETEIRTFVIDYYILVDDNCVLGNNTVSAKTISFQNTGVEATFTNVTLNVTKEV